MTRDVSNGYWRQTKRAIKMFNFGALDQYHTLVISFPMDNPDFSHLQG